VPRHVLFDDGSELHFHGIGCSYESNELTVSFDFGPNGRFDGFNAGLLAEFAEESCNKQLDFAQIERELKQLLACGKVLKPSWHPGVDLLYLAEGALV
jgi:hypothetical protein